MLRGSTFFTLWVKPSSVTIQMKATEWYFPAVLFIELYRVVLTFEFIDEFLKCDHSVESYYWAVPSYGVVIKFYKVVLSFEHVKKPEDVCTQTRVIYSITFREWK